MSSQDRKKIRLVDRISDLPDSLITRILSVLDTKDVVKTSVLSKRWKDIWTQVNSFVYNYGCRFMPYRGELMSDEHLKRYIIFIDATLMQCVSNVEKFSLSGFECFNVEGMSLKIKIDEWIQFVIAEKVEILEINGEGLEYEVPDSLYRCSSLVGLQLSTVGISLAVPVNWPLLKSLYLMTTYALDKDVENICLGCPMIETLVLHDVEGLNLLRITSASLKILKLVAIVFDDNSVYKTLEIKAPLLQELEISCTMVIKCVLLDVSSLVKANLGISMPLSMDGDGYVEEFKTEWVRMVAELLKSIRHVGELYIESELLQVMSLLSLPGKPSPTFMCKHVTIVSPLWKYDLYGIIYLLGGAPHMETLEVDVSRWQNDYPIDQIREVFSARDLQLTFPKGNLTRLKNVKIDYHRNPCTDCVNSSHMLGNCLDFELVGYILRSCVALERLVLCSGRACLYKNNCLKPNCAFQYVHNMSSRLLTDSLPPNGNAEWELKKRYFSLEYTFSNYASMHSED